MHVAKVALAAVLLPFALVACAADDVEETESATSALPCTDCGGSGRAGYDPIYETPTPVVPYRDTTTMSDWYCSNPSTPWICKGGIAGYKCFQYQSCAGASSSASRL